MDHSTIHMHIIEEDTECAMYEGDCLMPHTQSRVMRITSNVQKAVTNNDLDELSNLYPTYSFFLSVKGMRGTPNDEAVVTAGMYGRVNILDWLYCDSTGPLLTTEAILEDSIDAMLWAAYGGHLSVLQWFYSEPTGPWIPRDYFLKDNGRIICGAASKGHISILQWLCFDPEGPLITQEELCGIGEDLVMSPASNGWTDVLEWLFLSNAGPCIPLYHLTNQEGLAIALYESKLFTLDTLTDPVRGGVKALQWLRDNIDGANAQFFRAHNNELLAHCCARGYEEAIKWLCICEEGPQLGEDSFLENDATNVISVIERRCFDLLQNLLGKVLTNVDKIVCAIDRVWIQFDDEVQEEMMHTVFPLLPKWDHKYAPWESGQKIVAPFDCNGPYHVWAWDCLVCN